MTPEDFYEAEANRLQAEWEAGDFRAVLEAFLLFAWREPQFPDWLTSETIQALTHAFEDRHAAKAARIDKHKRRHFLADFWLRNRGSLPALGHPATREGAFAITAEMLRDNVTAEAIERSYERVEKEGKKRPQKLA